MGLCRELYVVALPPPEDYPFDALVREMIGAMAAFERSASGRAETSRL